VKKQEKLFQFWNGDFGFWIALILDWGLRILELTNPKSAISNRQSTNPNSKI